MVNLIIKDILIQKKTVLFSFLYIIFIIFAFQSVAPAMFSTGTVAFTYMLVLTSCAHEDKNKSDVMINSLPIKRSNVVLAKYISVFVFFSMGIAAYIISTAIISILGIPIKVFPITLKGIVAAVFAVTFINGIYFPIFFKVGYIKSKVINFITFFVTFAGTTTLANNKENVFVKGAIDLFSNQPETLIVSLIAAFVIIILTTSFAISVKFYKNREF